MRNRIALSVITLSAYLANARVAYAQSNPPQITGLTDMFMSIIDFAFPIAALVALFMIVYGGYLWMVSGQDPQKIASAQGTLVWSVLGLVFIALLRIILTAVLEFLGV